MTDRQIARRFREYFRVIAETRASGLSTEHSHRPALQALVESLAGSESRALNEPSHIKCGAPDFIVELDGAPIGHIECKDLGANLDREETTEQIKRYRSGLPNLILTNYAEFRWYTEGEFRQSGVIGRLRSNQSPLMDSDGIRQTAELFRGFFNANTPIVEHPRELAVRMAAKARLLRGCLNDLFDQEDEQGRFNELLAAYREVLISGLTQDAFADLQAQTAAYGLFAAWCIHDYESGPFSRQSAAFAATNPFLRDVFGQIAGPGLDDRISWIVDDLALLLNRAERDSVLAQFNAGTQEEDVVVHFYEDFLSEYDPALRELRGVYYTPEPVVSYIVRSVDHLVRHRLGIQDGLANKERFLSQGPNGLNEDSPKVLILDPAAGTGTFCRSIIKTVKATVERSGLGGAWDDYVQSHLLPRLYGFELLMAPYAVCHLKLAIEIDGAGPKQLTPRAGRINIFLTNALEEAHEPAAGPLFGHEIAHEAASADAVKRDKPVMVIVGNPPYSGHSANKGVWIRNLLQGKGGADISRSYFHVNGAPLREPNLKWLHDDYVKFIRFSQWRIEQTGEGVLGFITNHSYLDSPTFRGMRESLMKTFDEIYLLDLHGNSKRRERTPAGGVDENVFDIQQGVAIGLFVKKARSEDMARVFHADLWGRRIATGGGGKYGWLTQNDVNSTNWTEIEANPPRYLFIPRDESRAQEFESGWAINELFPDHSLGIATARDKLAIQFSKEKLGQVISKFCELPVETARLEFNLRRDSRDWKVAWAQQDLKAHPNAEHHTKQILYRPFDERFTYYTGRSRGFICMPRPAVMRHMLAGPNIGLSTSRGIEISGGWEHVFASTSIIQLHTVSQKESNYLFPLYRYPVLGPDTLGRQREPNISREFITHVGEILSLRFIEDGAGDLTCTFGPEDVLHYSYALLHSPEYRRRFADYLKSDFPRIPVTTNLALFQSLTRLGADLISLHTLAGGLSDGPIFPVDGSRLVNAISFLRPCEEPTGCVFINEDQFFEGVPRSAWEFTIGGYQPAKKWLEDRKSKILSFVEISQYRDICAALADTSEIMTRIDQTIESHGGWPLSD